MYTGGGRPGAGLHGWEVPYEVLGEVLEAGEDLDGACPEVRLVVRDVVLGAELEAELARLAEVVPGDGREEVVLDLVVEAAAEPVYKAEAVLEDVARRRHLELPVVGALGGVIDGHAVVAERKHEGEHEAARHVGDEEEEEALGEGRQLRDDGEVPRVVEAEEEDFELFVRHRLELVVRALDLAARRVVEVGDVGEGLLEPGEARKGEEREVDDVLVGDHEARERALRELEHRLRPGEEGHRVDVRVAVLRVGARRVHVGHGVVRVVLVLPP
mmetsp:Transcript_3818/g.11669  ORF Transcript_3818/g.11669 Transcript_3818/m.11669 type:complete len:272 (+) Transcript_3818:281-1096(+)